MVVKQVTLDFPPEILAGVESGAYKVFGSVVRDERRIIAHLKDAPLPVKSKDIDITRLAAGLKDPRAIILIGIGVAVVGGVAAAAVVAKKLNDKNHQAPQIIESYNASLAGYLVAIHRGSVNLDVLNRLIADLDDLKGGFDSGQLSIEFSAEQTTALLALVLDYTTKLAEANSYEMGEQPNPTQSSVIDSLLQLRHYLEVQVQIIKSAA